MRAGARGAARPGADPRRALPPAATRPGTAIQPDVLRAEIEVARLQGSERALAAAGAGGRGDAQHEPWRARPMRRVPELARGAARRGAAGLRAAARSGACAPTRAAGRARGDPACRGGHRCDALDDQAHGLRANWTGLHHGRRLGLHGHGRRERTDLSSEESRHDRGGDEHGRHGARRSDVPCATWCKATWPARAKRCSRRARGRWSCATTCCRARARAVDAVLAAYTSGTVPMVSTLDAARALVERAAGARDGGSRARRRAGRGLARVVVSTARRAP